MTAFLGDLLNLQQDQKDFLKVCSVECFDIHEVVHATNTTEREEKLYVAIKLAKRLIDEEVNKELFVAVDNYLKLLYHHSLVPIDGGFQTEAMPILEEILDGAVDSVYVILYLLNILDLPFNTAWVEIQKTNMAKAIKNEDGSYKVKRRASDNKILKPDGWQPPNIKAIIVEHLRAFYENKQRNET